jgi:hypothetical protein
MGHGFEHENVRQLTFLIYFLKWEWKTKLIGQILKLNLPAKYVLIKKISCNYLQLKALFYIFYAYFYFCKLHSSLGNWLID